MRYICKHCKSIIHVNMLTSYPPKTILECLKCGKAMIINNTFDVDYEVDFETGDIKAIEVNRYKVSRIYKIEKIGEHEE